MIPALRLSCAAVCAAIELSVRCSQDPSDLRTVSVLSPDRRGEPVVTEEDALRAQRLMEFESLAVSNLHFATRMKVLTINISLMALIWVRILTAGCQAFPLTTVAFHAGIVMTHLHYRSLHLPPVTEEPTDFHSDAAPFVDDINMDSDESNASRSSSTHSPVHVCTDSDGNDLFRQYQGAFPSYDPKNLTVLENLCDDSTFQQSEHSNEPGEHRESYFAPFLNATVWRLMEWFYSSTQKSIGDLDHLVHDVILADNFDREDLCDFSAQRETRRLDEAPRDPSSSRFTSDRWHTTSIPIRLPCERVKQSEENAPVFQVEGLHYRKITEVIRSAFEEPAAQTFHTTPYKLYWQLDKNQAPERVFTEVYTADAMLREHEKVKTSPKVAGCNLETVIAAIMFWSDLTHLASFGNAALWPIYLFLGNQSKYTRAKPTSFAAHHLAYIPKVPIYSDVIL